MNYLSRLTQQLGIFKDAPLPLLLFLVEAAASPVLLCHSRRCRRRGQLGLGRPRGWEGCPCFGGHPEGVPRLRCGGAVSLKMETPSVQTVPLHNSGFSCTFRLTHLDIRDLLLAYIWGKASKLPTA